VDPVLIVFGGLVAFLVLLAVALGGWHPKPGSRIVGTSLRDEGAEAEIEAHDIDQMLDSINELRRRTGRRDVGEELADEAMRSTWSE
jgi:hypothetical protein